MATNDEKKLPEAPSVYGGAYDQQINDLYKQYSERPDFQYSVDGDALYQQYRDKYVQNAKRSMKDTMGQAATLTGGYGSSYAQGVGQQRYDEQMRSLTDVIPELEGRAFERYQQQGEDILNQYNLANQLGAADQATRQYQQEWDFNQQQYTDQQVQQAYQNLSSAIMASGYQPTQEELTAAGMTQQQADALRQAWIAADPNSAWMQGAITAAQYIKLTGKNPPGYKPAGSGYSGGSSKKPKKTKENTTPAAPTIGAMMGLVNGLTGNWAGKFNPKK
ncbi:MAG: hypothetical protein J6W82_05120 [Bacteroidales bacterium]|nr:hypothetical protein [Bacteroidales bacterium]